MGMTNNIDESIKELSKWRKNLNYDNGDYCYGDDITRHSLDIAVDTMRKYQKIKNIICKWEDGLYDDEGLCHTEVLEMISDEVNGNGNVD